MASSRKKHQLEDEYRGEKEHLVRDVDSVQPEVESIEVVIWTRDRKGIHVTLEGDGTQAESADMFEIVKDHRRLNSQYDKMFSIWMVSPLLEFRLKNNHKPFHIAQLWDDFCALYTDANADEIARDEPVVMFQRNVYLPLQEERKTSNEEVLALLYHEAKYNVVDGRYALRSQKEYDTLAGIEALIEQGPFDENKHTAEFYKGILNKFYPPHIYKPKKSLLQSLKKNTDLACEERVREEHVSISEKYRSVNLDEYKIDLYQQYLDICRSYPFYGAAFFEAVLEKKTGKVKTMTNNLLSLGQPEIEVLVAINTDGVCIIEQDHKSLLLAVPYEELSWDLDKNEDEGGDKLACLLLQFLHNEGDGSFITKVLQVYSRQANPMDKLIESCVFLKKNTGFEPDRQSRADGFREELPCQMGKLCLTSYTVDGEQIPD